MTTTAKQNRSPKEAATMPKTPKTLAQLQAQAQDVRASLAVSLVKGDATASLREFLVELEAQIAAARQHSEAERARAAVEQAAQVKSDAIRKFEEAHPVAVRLIAEAAERRMRRSEVFAI